MLASYSTADKAYMKEVQLQAKPAVSDDCPAIPPCELSVPPVLAATQRLSPSCAPCMY